MESKTVHYLILAGILLIAVIGAAITGKQSPTGMTQMGLKYEDPYYLENPTYSLRPPVEPTRLPGAPYVPTNPQRQPAKSYKVEPVYHIREFFGTTMIFYPDANPCLDIIQKYMRQLELTETTRMDMFKSGTGTDKMLVMLYEDIESQLGTLTLARGFGDPNQYKMIYDLKKTIIGISDWQEYVKMHIETIGRHAGDRIYCQGGKVEITSYDENGNSEPLFECSFGY